MERQKAGGLTVLIPRLPEWVPGHREVLRPHSELEKLSLRLKVPGPLKRLGPWSSQALLEIAEELRMEFGPTGWI